MKILGFTEDRNTCDCCGKQGLKGTYAVEYSDGILYFGSTCVKSKAAQRKAYQNMFNQLGGNEIRLRMQEIEAFTPEHDDMLASLEAIEIKCKEATILF